MCGLRDRFPRRICVSRKSPVWIGRQLKYVNATPDNLSSFDYFTLQTFSSPYDSHSLLSTNPTNPRIDFHCELIFHLLRVFALCHNLHPPSLIVVRPAQSERLVYLENLESPNFTGHPYRPALQPDRIRHQLLPVGIYRSLKNGRKCCIRRLWVKFLENGISEDTSGTVTLVCLLDMTWLAVSFGCILQLNTACKCIKRDQPATSRIIQLLYNII